MISAKLYVDVFQNDGRNPPFALLNIDYTSLPYRHIQIGRLTIRMIYDPARRAIELRQRILELMAGGELEEYARSLPRLDQEASVGIKGGG
jgi:hypothetical protein